MTPHIFTITVGLIFSLIAAMHALRLLKGWPVTLGTWRAPIWISWLGLAIAAFLAYTAFTL